MLNNVVGDRRVYNFLEKTLQGVWFNYISVTRGWVKFPEKKRYITLEWALVTWP